MNGPEHYREAEKDLDRASNRPVGDEADYYNSQAQVHAALALAAATVEVADWLRVTAGGDVEEALPWLQVIRS